MASNGCKLLNIINFGFRNSDSTEETIKLLGQDTRAVYHRPSFITVEEIKIITAALTTSNSQFLKFSPKNNLSSSHGEYIASMLSLNNSLLVLNLGSVNKLNNETISRLASSLESNYCLEHLTFKFKESYSVEEDTHSVEKITRCLVRNRVLRIRREQIKKAIFYNFLNNKRSISSISRSNLFLLGPSSLTLSAILSDVINEGDVKKFEQDGDPIKLQLTLNSSDKTWKFLKREIEQKHSLGLKKELVSRYTLKRMKKKKIKTWKRPKPILKSKQKISLILKNCENNLTLLRNKSKVKTKDSQHERDTERVKVKEKTEEEREEYFENLVKIENNRKKRYGIGKGRSMEEVTMNTVYQENMITMNIYQYLNRADDFKRNKLFHTKSRTKFTQVDNNLFIICFELSDFMANEEDESEKVTTDKALFEINTLINDIKRLGYSGYFLLIAGYDNEVSSVTSTQLIKIDVTLRASIELTKLKVYPNTVTSSDKELCFFPVAKHECGSTVRKMIEDIYQTINTKLIIPLKWLKCVEYLVQLADTEQDVIISLSFIREILSSKFKITNKKEVSSILGVFHTLKLVYYLNIKNYSYLNKHVCTDIDFIKQKIKYLHTVSTLNNEREELEMERVGLLKDYAKHVKDKVISIDLLEYYLTLKNVKSNREKDKIIVEYLKELFDYNFLIFKINDNNHILGYNLKQYLDVTEDIEYTGYIDFIENKDMPSLLCLKLASILIELHESQTSNKQTVVMKQLFKNFVSFTVCGVNEVSQEGEEEQKDIKIFQDKLSYRIWFTFDEIDVIRKVMNNINQEYFKSTLKFKVLNLSKDTKNENNTKLVDYDLHTFLDQL